MNSVTLLELAKKIIHVLAVREGEALDLAQLRDGSVLLRKAESTELDVEEGTQ
jgi:hypothetical protein